MDVAWVLVFPYGAGFESGCEQGIHIETVLCLKYWRSFVRIVIIST
jgi:hypothetical protein